MHWTLRQLLSFSVTLFGFKNLSWSAVSQGSKRGNNLKPLEGARTTANRTRNVPDEVLQKIVDKKIDAVIMTVFYSGFVQAPSDHPDYRECTTVDHVVDHMMHIGETYGWQYVGIGGDYNGADPFPHDLENVSKDKLSLFTKTY